MLHKSTFSIPGEPLLLPILVPLLIAGREKKCQRLKQERRQHLRNAENDLFKNIKNHWFFHVFGSESIPKQYQKTQRVSQDTPKDVEKLKKSYI